MTLSALALLLGCVGSRRQENAIGVTNVDIVETTDRTTIIGRNGEGREIARVDLVHGRFTLSPEFADDGVKEVVGRKLDVRALDQSMRWETIGFTPTLSLPAHPRDQWALAAFLEDQRVEPVLRTWGIAFSRAPDIEDFICDLEGTHPHDCSGQTTCPTLLMDPAKPPPNTCGGGGLPASEAWTVHQRANAGYHLDRSEPGEVEFDQSVIAQCCPPTQATNYPSFAKKTCPDRADCSPQNPCVTSCGTITISDRNSCAACPAYPVHTKGKCTIRIDDTGRTDPLAPGGPAEIVNVCARYKWRCGDGVCDIDEDCDNCSKDCGCDEDQVCVSGPERARCRHEGE
jgi:hypothetical protein